MKKDMIFFSTDGNGLTSTSANHIANMAKEMVRDIESSLVDLTLYSTSVALIGNGSVNTIREGDKADTLEEIRGKLHTVAKANSLIAWLREAIKAKERLLDETATMTMEEYMKMKDITLPKAPERGKALTEDEYYASLSVDQRNRYYALEALASVLGKAIHPDGAVANAREELGKRIRNPRSVEGNGRDALIYEYLPTVTMAQVDEVYFKLQNEFRETQAALNAIKFECRKALKESEIEVQTAYAEAQAKYDSEWKRILAELTTYVKKHTREIGDYKIIIPQSLKGIYDEVTSLGKK